MELKSISSSKPPQISDMFQKFAVAFKSKTFDFFNEEATESAAVSDTDDGFTLLDSTEDFITDQKAIIIKPDFNSKSQTQSQTKSQNASDFTIQPFDPHFGFQVSLSLGKETQVLIQTRDLTCLFNACRSSHRFTKILIRLMRKAGFAFDLAADYIHPDVVYAKKGHNRYAFLSYVCLSMFQGFDSESFGVDANERFDNSMELFEHESVNELDSLNKNRNFLFSRFCERKYAELVHPTMESSIFKNLDRKDVMDSWRSVEKGVGFSMIYMEDVTKKAILENGISKVAFTVIPGFKIGRTVIQSQVYLTGSKSTK